MIYRNSIKIYFPTFQKEIFVYSFFLIVFFIVPFFAQAQATDSFTVRTLVGADTATPTVPTNFTTTPITTSQIDLNWDPSSDNYSVAGYQVFRDSVQIATTTLTAYSDTGLASSTLYTYFITAFDTSFNYASPTASVATSTLTPTPTPVATSTPATSSSTQGFINRDIELLNFKHEATQNTIDISFNTNVYVRAVVRWGRTFDYESGYIASDAFRKDHGTVLEGLESGTIYDIEIILTSRSGNKELRYTTTIQTESGPDTQAPPNVSNLRVHLSGSGAQLLWSNPSVTDFSHVRVLSSDYFYPTHIADGWLVYDGIEESVFDSRPIESNHTRYYTVFVYDTAGNISSGAVTRVTRGFDQGVDTDTVATSTDVIPWFLFKDIVFIQNDTQAPFFNDVVTLRGSENTTISIPYALLPEHLKTIVVTLKHPEDIEKEFSFLLRINPDKTAYEAHIGPLIQGGNYTIHVEVFNFDTKELYTVEGIADVQQSTLDSLREHTYASLWPKVIQRYGWFILLILLVLILLGYRVIHRERHEDSAL